MDHYQKILKKYYSEKKHNPKIKLDKRKKRILMDTNNKKRKSKYNFSF